MALKNRGVPAVLAFAFFFLLVLVSDKAQSQIATDGTLGPETALDGPNFNIGADLGQQDGANLFHSFRTFNIQSGESAAFNGPSSVESIISRVTGGEQSLINGLLRSEIAGANLFFLNPAGVLFGPDATLEVDGSFHVTTADYLRLGEEGLFSAADPAGSRLASAPPSAFGFLGENPSGVTFLGSGSTLAEERLGYNGIKVPEGETLSVIAGDIGVHTYVLDNGVGLETRLKAPSGRLNLASVRSSGEVVLSGTDLDVSAFSALGDIAITQGSWISASAEAAGDVYIRGGQLVLDDQDRPQNLEWGGVFVNSLGDGRSGKIDIDLRGDLSVFNGALIASSENAAGGGGAVDIVAENVRLSNGGEIYTSTSGSGNGPDVAITAADVLELQSNSKIAGWTYAEGAGGDIQLEAKNISLSGGSWIDALSDGPGSGGNLTLSARESIELQDTADIMTIAYGAGNGGALKVSALNRIDISGGAKMASVANGEGDGGDVTIASSEEICVTGKAEGEWGMASSVIAAQTNGDGDAGDLMISTRSLKLSDYGSISSGNYLPGSGQAGDINIETESIEVGSWGSISSGGFGQGRGGDIQIDATEKVIIDGFSAEEENSAMIESSPGEDSEGAGNILIRTPSLMIINNGAISTQMSGEGEAGEIEIKVDTLTVKGGLIESMTTDGKSGDIRIKAEDSLELLYNPENDGFMGPKSWISSSTIGKGNAGNVDVTAPSLIIEDKGGFYSISDGSGRGGNINVEAGKIELHGKISCTSEGSGAGGNINLAMDTLHINGGEINTGTVEEGFGDGGNICITAANEVRLFGQNSEGRQSAILSNAIGKNEDAGDGGDILIDAGALIIEDGAMMSATSTGSGDSGGIYADIQDNITMSGNNESGLSSTIMAMASDAGDGGTIELKANNIILDDGAQIMASTSGTGKGGKIALEVVDTVELRGEELNHSLGSNIIASSGGEMPDAGPGGSISLSTDHLVIRDGGSISVHTTGPGKGGNLDISAAGDIFVGGQSSIGWPSMITGITNGEEANAGDGGDLTIKAGSIELAEGGNIDSSTYGAGSGGKIVIYAEESIKIKGLSAGYYSLPSSIKVSTSWKNVNAGNGGDLSVRAGSLELTEGGAIYSSSDGPGDAGSISIHAGESIYIHGYNETGKLQSSIRAEALMKESEAGDGGKIAIDTRTLRISDRGAITASTNGAGRGGGIVVQADQIDLSDNATIESQSTGTGAGGDIQLTAASRIDLSNSAITTQTTASDGGSMDIQAADLIYLKDSQITTSVQGGAGNGGNISIDPRLVILDHSEIIANAHGGAGGNIAIVADQLMADPYSTIEASSELGLDGQIHIDAPAADISGALAVLPGAFLDASALMSDPCDLRTAQDASSLVAAGFGDAHLGPDELFPSFSINQK